MKALILISALSMTGAALADVRKTYSPDAIELANVLKNCTIELDSITKSNPGSRIVSAQLESQNDVDTYTIQFAAGGMAPALSTFPVGALQVSKTFVKSQLNAPDAPGGYFEFNCKVIPDEQFEIQKAAVKAALIRESAWSGQSSQ